MYTEGKWFTHRNIATYRYSCSGTEVFALLCLWFIGPPCNICHQWLHGFHLRLKVLRRVCVIEWVELVLYAGELVCKKPTEPLDGAPFIAGTVTLLKQFHSENTEHFFALLGQYVRSAIASTHGFVCAITHSVSFSARVELDWNRLLPECSCGAVRKCQWFFPRPNLEHHNFYSLFMKLQNSFALV